jgi:pSer/pThr/pTyr-binding forkhead associated (FHA) protein
MTELIIQTGKHQGKTIDLAGTDCIIGRQENCKIRIASEDVSKQHCRLKHKPDGLYLKDLGSRNGTFLNDQQVTEEVKIQPGDLLRVGPMTFLVALGKPSQAKTSASAGAVKSVGGSDTDDDMIAAWLSEGGDLEKSGHDTTEVMPPQTAQKAAPPAASDGKEPPASDSSLKSVRDRSQEIIRRWHKLQGKG